LRHAVLFDVGGPIDLEFAHEIALEGAIAAACGMEGIATDQAAIDAASEKAVETFAPDAYAHMIETLCGDPRTVARVRHRVQAMVGNLDVFQLRPGIDELLRKLRHLHLRLGIVANQPRERLERGGVLDLVDCIGPDSRAVAEALGVTPAECIMVGDRIDNDIAPARALGMATILFRSGRHRRQRPRSPAEEPHAVVTDVAELETAITKLLAVS
jgi:putative hydrolase of the HAD superfamily